MNTERNSPQTEKAPLGLHVVAKPVGPVCNLDCEYCFYLEKQALFATHEKSRMSDDVLRAFITGYISSQPTPVVEFVWQGGEPTLLRRVRTVIKALAPELPLADADALIDESRWLARRGSGLRDCDVLLHRLEEYLGKRHSA